jgi:hypothetical protein
MLKWSQSCEVEMLGFWWENQPNCNGPGFRVVNNRSNGSVPVRTLTQNRSSRLEPLLTPVSTTEVVHLLCLHYSNTSYVSPFSAYHESFPQVAIVKIVGHGNGE